MLNGSSAGASQPVIENTVWWHTHRPFWTYVEFYLLWRRLKPVVRGWLSRDSAWLLYKLARWGPGQGVILEVGSAWGRSTIVLAAASKSAGREKVVAVDPHTGDISQVKEGQEPINTHHDFLRNIRRFDVDDWVQPIVLRSVDAAKEWDGRPIRLLYIDGWHTYEAVKADIESWFPYLVRGGIILFDDYSNASYPEVKRGIDDLMTADKVRLPLKVFRRKVWTQKI
jgi:predicted O-methyltransferase YrrM